MSSNWAGYAVTAPTTTYTNVTATWRLPTVSCDAQDAGSASSFWVGLGGYSLTSQALEQIGADSDCTSRGEPTYYAWYELVPAPSVDLSLEVRPGNILTASVNALDDGAMIELQLIDRSRGTRVTKLLPDAAPDLTSAEWVAEAPSDCNGNGNSCTVVPLADFDSVTFTNLAATGNGYGGTASDTAWSSDAIQLQPEPQTTFNGYPGGGRYGGSPDTNAGADTGALSAPTGKQFGDSFTVDWVANALGG